MREGGYKMERQLERSKMRFESFSGKYQGERLEREINLRTKKITNPEKLMSWIAVLENKNFNECADYARVKAMAMGIN